MPLESWVQHSRVDQFLYDWQTLIAGVLAILAAGGTIWATIKSANREIAASQAQTAVAQKQIEMTLRLEQDRVAHEARAFRTMLGAAMMRVLSEIDWAKKNYPSTFVAEGGPLLSLDALTVRQCITKGAFAELRGVCVKGGDHLTSEFLDLEREIDSFASQYEDKIHGGSVAQRWGKAPGLVQQIAVIEDKATKLRDKAARDPFGLVLPGRAGTFPYAPG
jgi:hypothetical protein